MSDAAQQSLSPLQPGLTPWKVIQTYSPEEWELFIIEWTEGFEPKYRQVVHLAGAGDKGRDVLGYIGDPTDQAAEWDNYQCKHYDHALRPSDVWIELGKLCVYTQRGDYTMPRRYRFVCPCGVGTKLHDLLKKPEELKKQLIANWDKDCKAKISEAAEFPLEDDLKAFVEAFDFGIVWFLTPQEVLNQHERTKYWHRRFKLDPPRRPDYGTPPDDVQPHELPYTTCLLAAYGDHLKQPIAASADLSQFPPLLSHFRRSRGYFFTAEALARFSRDHFSPGAFDVIKQHVADAVLDVTQDAHPDGYSCVLKTTEVAAGLPLPDNDLVPYVSPADKKGICHHLANDGKLCWVRS
jgi:hypothetical protein